MYKNANESKTVCVIKINVIDKSCSCKNVANY